MEKRTKRWIGLGVIGAMVLGSMVWLGVGSSGPGAVLAAPVGAPRAWSAVQEDGRSELEVRIAHARYRQQRHEHALELQMEDRRWAMPQQRWYMAMAVRDTIQTIEEQRAIAETLENER